MSIVEARFPAWLSVSRETDQKLTAFLALVVRWNHSINLIASGDAEAIWSRHILDSAQLFELAATEALNWADLGSGGGLPGIVVSILAAEVRPALRVTLVEADRRKSVFLSEAIRQLGLNASVVTDRIENIAPLGAEIISARALAPLPVLLGYANRHALLGTKMFFHKGARAQIELQAARQSWSFDCVEHPSRTDPAAIILEISGLEHA